MSWYHHYWVARHPLRAFEPKSVRRARRRAWKVRHPAKAVAYRTFRRG